MAKVAEGDPRAQRLLAHRLVARTRDLCHMLLTRPADADDASQEALLEILKSAGSFRAEASVEHWAARITVRTALRWTRTERRKTSHLDPGADPAAAPAPAETHLRDRAPRRIEAYLKALSPERREVLVLKHALGYSVDEIAARLQTSVGTIKDRLVQGRKQVRKLIRRDVKLGRRRAEA